MTEREKRPQQSLRAPAAGEATNAKPTSVAGFDPSDPHALSNLRQALRWAIAGQSPADRWALLLRAETLSPRVRDEVAAADRSCPARPIEVRERSEWCRCGARHKTIRKWVQHNYKEAHWVRFEGEWAVLSECRYLTITLCGTESEARATIAAKDLYACGGFCHRGHYIVHLVGGALL